MLQAILMLLRKIIVALTPRHWKLKTTTKEGVSIFGRNKKGYGGRGIYIFREAIEKEFEVLEHFLSEDDVFIDIGANTGIFSLKAAHYLKRGTVVSFEPQVEIAAMLEYSRQQNGFRHMRVRNLAVSNEVTSIDMTILSGQPNSASIVESSSVDEKISVLTTTLDYIVEWEKLEKISYIKIDAEGAEEHILEGGNDSIQRFRPIIQCESTIRDMTNFKLENYTRYRYPGSMNVLFVPEGHPKTAALNAQGFVALEDDKVTSL